MVPALNAAISSSSSTSIAAKRGYHIRGCERPSLVRQLLIVSIIPWHVSINITVTAYCQPFNALRCDAASVFGNDTNYVICLLV
jgi:hypothetical protein